MPEVVASHYLDLGPELPEDVKETAIKQGEDPERVGSAISEFRQMIHDRGECKPFRTDDGYLLKFLRARFFKVENAYKLLVRHYAFREENKTLFEDVHPFKLRNIGNHELVSTLPYLDQNGHRVLHYKIKNWKPSLVSVDDLFRATIVILEVGAIEPRGQVLGGIGLIDLEGLSLRHVCQLSPSVAQKLISIVVSTMPMRVTAVHVVNQNWAFDAGFKILKPFLSERMRKQLFIHGSDLSSLHKHIDPRHLPVKYGGTLPEYSFNDWLNKLCYGSQIQQELRNLRFVIPQEEVDETKRLYGDKNLSDY